MTHNELLHILRMNELGIQLIEFQAAHNQLSINLWEVLDRRIRMPIINRTQVIRTMIRWRIRDDT